MTYLEKLIEKELYDGGYYLVGTSITKVASDIDTVNETQDALYDVRDWIHDYQQKYLIDILPFLTDCAKYFEAQDHKCIADTGGLPHLTDYIESVSCEEFENTVCDKHIEFSDIFRMFVDYYRQHEQSSGMRF